jgi:hypothetical protein
VSWDVLGLSVASKPADCATCGEPLKPERRRPGRRPTKRRFSPGVVAERRDVAPPPGV